MTTTCRIAASFSVALAACAATSCGDPVHDHAVKALGDERGGVPLGEYHRAGQPCVTCHGEFGPAKLRFSLAGTVFNGPSQAIGEDQVTIELIDAEGQAPIKQLLTNCVGNFFVTQDDYQASFPVSVWIRKGSSLRKMQSHIGRDGSCNQCHQDVVDHADNNKLKASFDRVGHVTLYPNDNNLPAAPPPCPVTNVAAIGGGP